MNKETPKIFLSFDDCHIKAWHDYLPTLKDNKVSATFYLCFAFGEFGYHEITSDDWAKLKEIEADGHTIGFHGYEHKAACRVVDTYGIEGYLEKEIHRGLEEFDSHGFDVKHFSYPFGNCREEIHEKLLEIFQTLRVAVIFNPPNDCYYKDMKIYDDKELREERVLMSIDIRTDEVFHYINKAKEENNSLFLFAHSTEFNWVRLSLKEIICYAKSREVEFCSMNSLEN